MEIVINELYELKEYMDIPRFVMGLWELKQGPLLIIIDEENNCLSMVVEDRHVKISLSYIEKQTIIRKQRREL
jgi:hypothetical protein